MRPSTRVKVALRAALNRRYAYAALRTLRRGLAAALEDHLRRSLAPGRYSSELEAVSATYWRGLKRLEKRFRRPPPFADPRARP